MISRQCFWSRKTFNSHRDHQSLEILPQFHLFQSADMSCWKYDSGFPTHRLISYHCALEVDVSSPVERSGMIPFSFCGEVTFDPSAVRPHRELCSTRRIGLIVLRSGTR